MIATGLVFALGALLAVLLALLFVPFLWRKAQRLARRDFDATIPTSVGEVRAEIDAVRAAAAFDVRRQEMRLAESRAAVTRERAEAGRIVLENGDLRLRETELQGELTEAAATMRALQERLDALSGERDELHETRQDLKQRLHRRTDELNALTAKHQALGEALDEHRLRLAAAETRILELSGVLAGRTAKPARTAPPARIEPVDASPPAPGLAAPASPILPAIAAPGPEAPLAVAALPASVGPTASTDEPSAAAPAADDASPNDAPSNAAAETVPVPDIRAAAESSAPPALPAPLTPIALPAPGREAISGSNRLRAAIAARAGARRDPSREENAEIRERISDIAARVIQRQAEAEGPGSILASILAGSGTPAPDAPPTLADRVRRLMGEKDGATPAPSPTDTGGTTGSPAPAPNARAAKRSGGARSRPKSPR